MLKPTQSTLDKLEELLSELLYKVRYEKGNFKSGSCLLLDNKVIVVNKFSTIETKVGSLAEILTGIEVDESTLSDKGRNFYRSLQQTKIDFKE